MVLPHYGMGLVDVCVYVKYSSAICCFMQFSLFLVPSLLIVVITVGVTHDYYVYGHDL